jgi:hypothetical protein
VAGGLVLVARNHFRRKERTNARGEVLASAGGEN